MVKLLYDTSITYVRPLEMSRSYVGVPWTATRWQEMSMKSYLI